MRKKRLAELVIMTMLGITACGGGASTSSSTGTVESLPAVESSISQETESIIDSIDSGAPESGEENLGAEETDTQFIGIDEEGKFSITEVISSAEEIIVPDNINGVVVGKIKKEAFAELNCKKIVIPDSVTSIGKCAFINCRELEEVQLGKGLVSIGSMAFQNCPKLKSIEFAEGLVTIKGTLFLGCDVLEDVIVPETAIDIEDGIGNIKTCPNLVIVTPAGSVAEEVALSQGIPVRHR